MKWLVFSLCMAIGFLGCGSDDDSDRVEIPRDAASTDVAVEGDGGAADSALANDAQPAGSDGRDAASADSRADAQTDASVLPCKVLLRPVSAPDLENLPAGPDAFVRVRGEIVGTPRPTHPQWNWQVLYQGQVVSVVDPDSADPALIRLPLRGDGDYDITVSVAMDCGGSEKATAVKSAQRKSNFILRLVPPAASRLPPQDIPEEMIAGMPKRADIRLAAGHDVAIIPQSGTAPFTPPPLVPSFVRIFSNGTSFEREGVTEGATGFQTRLGSSPILYNVLIVPQNNLLAPILVPHLTATSMRGLLVTVTPGATVQGRVTLNGVPIPDVRVMLRHQERPSTLGISDATGMFSLRARPGSHSVRVVGPVSSVLPVLQEEPQNPVSIASEAGMQMDIAYSDLSKATLSLVVMRPGGREPAAGTLVQLTSDVINNAATLNVGPVMPRALSGRVEFRATANAQGQVALPPLPRAHYQVMLRPPQDRAWPAAYQTPITVDLRAGDQALTTSLASPVSVMGKLPTTHESLAGLRVAAVEETTDPAAEEAMAAVEADGSFTMKLSPLTTYRLRVAPPLGRLVPQVVFGTFQTQSSDMSLPALPALPATLRFTGHVFNNLNVPVPGTLLQAFCTNNTQDCIDASRPSVGLAVPISEAVAGPDGSFVLVLPDPAG